MNYAYQTESPQERWEYWTEQKLAHAENLRTVREVQKAAILRQHYFGDVDRASLSAIDRQVAFHLDELDHAQRWVAYWWKCSVADGNVPTDTRRFVETPRSTV